MWELLKKLVGADEGSKARRREAAEEERRDREQRIRERKEGLERTAESEKDD